MAAARVFRGQLHWRLLARAAAGGTDLGGAALARNQPAVGRELQTAAGTSPQLFQIYGGRLSRWRQGEWQRGQRLASTDARGEISQEPELSDPEIHKTLRRVMALGWLDAHRDLKDEVDAALAKSTDAASKEVLESAWRTALAVEKFSEQLEHLRLALDSLSGGKFGGETVNVLPAPIQSALKSALTRYFAYLKSFGPDDIYLKKKVEQELGGSLLLLKQRVSGVEPDWAKVSLLATSGLSGSYIERREVAFT